MSECTDSGFFPEPLFPVRVLLKADVLQTLVVAGPLVMQLFLWLAWELFATKRPKTRAVINASGLVAGLCVAVQIIFVQRCFQVFQCLDIFDELDRWTIGSITILGAVNSISVGVLSPRVPRVAAALLVFIGGGIALTEYVFRSVFRRARGQAHRAAPGVRAGDRGAVRELHHGDVHPVPSRGGATGRA